MADKMERWERVGMPHAYMIVNKGKREELIADFYDNYKEADLTIALHNSALDINPSNPMAVAEGMGYLFGACRVAQAYMTEGTKPQRKRALAIIVGALAKIRGK